LAGDRVALAAHPPRRHPPGNATVGRCGRRGDGREEAWPLRETREAPWCLRLVGDGVVWWSPAMGDGWGWCVKTTGDGGARCATRGAADGVVAVAGGRGFLPPMAIATTACPLCAVAEGATGLQTGWCRFALMLEVQGLPTPRHPARPESFNQPPPLRRRPLCSPAFPLVVLHKAAAVGRRSPVSLCTVGPGSPTTSQAGFGHGHVRDGSLGYVAAHGARARDSMTARKE